MGLSDTIKKTFQPSPEEPGIEPAAHDIQSQHEVDDGAVEKGQGVIIQDENEAGGTVRVEAIQAVWGKNGKYIMWGG